MAENTQESLEMKDLPGNEKVFGVSRQVSVNSVGNADITENSIGFDL